MFSTGRITKIRGCELFTGSCRFPGCIALAGDKNMKILRKVNAMPLMFDFNIIAFFFDRLCPYASIGTGKDTPLAVLGQELQGIDEFPRKYRGKTLASKLLIYLWVCV